MLRVSVLADAEEELVRQLEQAARRVGARARVVGIGRSRWLTGRDVRIPWYPYHGSRARANGNFSSTIARRSAASGNPQSMSGRPSTDRPSEPTRSKRASTYHRTHQGRVGGRRTAAINPTDNTAAQLTITAPGAAGRPRRAARPSPPRAPGGARRAHAGGAAARAAGAC